MSKVKVGLVQMSCTNNKEKNLAKAIEGVKKAAADGAQIVCLQELFTSFGWTEKSKSLPSHRNW